MKNPWNLWIPKSYLDLQKLIIAEAKRRREQRNEWLCLSRDEYHTLIRSNAENDIASDEDVDLATQFLHEAGTLLYYGHHSEDMRQLYFIDPSWLAQTLAKFITLQASQNFVKDGILSLKKALPVLLKTREDISIQIISVLEAFNIALKLDDDRLLISSKLLNEKPPIQLHPATDAAASRVQRLYQMRYTPSGFWCRLITQILAMLNRFSSKSKADCHIYSMVSDSAVKTTYWQQGLRVDWPTGYACVESADSVWQCKDGLHITVSDSGGNFSWLGFFVDQVDSLIYQWYPGLSHDPSLEDSHCHILIPCPKCTSPESPHFFLLVDCVLSVVQGAMEITCVECSSAVPLSKLIPDVLLDDLPPAYVLAKERLDFNPDEGFLGAGAEGVVYKAVLDGRTAVAVKQSVLMRVVSYVHGANSSHSSSSSNSSGTTTEQLRSRLMPVCSSIRHEVGLMCGLQHPCIVSLLGVCMPILSYALEMAPLGSLRSVLNEKSKGFSGGQSCGLGSLLSFRVVYQIALGLSYLHSEAIVYKDMKADNILIWSLNPNDKNSVNVKLSDYGLSQYVGPQGLTGFEGTVGYQAPEMNHNAVYDNKIDIFACGMVIYEVMTGSYPFEQMPSIAVPHAIQDGERPKVKNEGIWMPHMISLMKQCWAQNPNERPSADDIISRMAREDFYALHAAYQQEALPVTCVLAIPDQMYLRFWTWCVDSHCEYHVFDTKNGLFKAQGEHLKGAAVNCMLWLRSSEVIVAQDEELKLLSLEPTTGGIIVLSTLQCSASPLRLLLCKPDSEASDEPQSFMASLSNGQIVSVAIAKKKLKMRVSLPLDKHPITALSFVESRRELWISCEHQVIILNPYLEIIDKFQLTGLRENRFIKDIVTQDDRVWVISNGSSVVYEYDVETRQELCQFNFGREVWPGAMVLSFVEDFAENGDPITVVMDNINHPQYRRKRSFRRSKKKSQSESTPTVNIRSLRIRSVLFVHGTLWVATSKGSIVVVNVTENNSHLVDYGQVLGVFKPTQATVGIVSVSLLPDNLCAVVSQEPPSSDDDRLPVLITVWRAFTLEEWAENTDFFKRMKLREEYCLSKWKNAKTASRTLSNPL
ncbi:hypothetical protein CAPTEDRAFT_227012 [Capitella teleta]|uniref:Protein kinase domain-containing protein n=1 Tax=Capitella teleta TaxID=283909 RepID=R7TUT6_CAPTE|nr:hypothetical protein CAPTEDRAFT_227012 [Capitella teleta]|eukprot:ELT95241.1 hypothetical protein CAPTEDRAFT_227012 [Capitella teleta]